VYNAWVCIGIACWPLSLSALFNKPDSLNILGDYVLTSSKDQVRYTLFYYDIFITGTAKQVTVIKITLHGTSVLPR